LAGQRPDELEHLGRKRCLRHRRVVPQDQWLRLQHAYERAELELLFLFRARVAKALHAPGELRGQRIGSRHRT
jgi:hypothetical protein